MLEIAETVLSELRSKNGRGERMTEIRLKPCPFCGSKAELLIVPGKMTKWAVRCTKCYANNGTFASDHDAVEAWNKRAEQPEITLESAIDYLHSIGWMQEHDRIMTESAPVVHAHWKDALISRQAAIEAVEKAATKECARWVIKEIPPVDAVPVVHAHNESETGFLCSACRFGDFGQFNHGGKYTPNFCPNCGAMMEE